VEARIQRRSGIPGENGFLLSGWAGTVPTVYGVDQAGAVDLFVAVVGQIGLSFKGTKSGEWERSSVCMALGISGPSTA